jgi:D-alanyl-D-alanine carboxypeptidase
MKLTYKPVILTLSITAALSTMGNAQAQTVSDAVACYSNLVANPAASGISGISVALLKDDQVLIRRGFGVVAPGSTRTVQPTTRFRTGSTLKGMTAAGLLASADQRLAPTSTPLLIKPVFLQVPGLNLPGRNDWAALVRPIDLISHQGGLQDDNNLDGPRDPAALLSFFRNSAEAPPPGNAPGKFFNYANTNFMLAGAVLEATSGIPYTQAMSQRVFQPLGMNRMTFSIPAVQADGDFAFGIEGGQVLGPDAYYRASFAPAGLAWGTVDDLTKWARFLMKGNTNLMTNQYWRAMVTPQVNTREVLDLQSYGTSG